MPRYSSVLQRLPRAPADVAAPFGTIISSKIFGAIAWAPEPFTAHSERKSSHVVSNSGSGLRRRRRWIPPPLPKLAFGSPETRGSRRRFRLHRHAQRRFLPARATHRTALGSWNASPWRQRRIRRSDAAPQFIVAGANSFIGHLCLSEGLGPGCPVRARNTQSQHQTPRWKYVFSTTFCAAPLGADPPGHRGDYVRSQTLPLVAGPAHGGRRCCACARSTSNASSALGACGGARRRQAHRPVELQWECLEHHSRFRVALNVARARRQPPMIYTHTRNSTTNVRTNQPPPHSSRTVHGPTPLVFGPEPPEDFSTRGFDPACASPLPLEHTDPRSIAAWSYG